MVQPEVTAVTPPAAYTGRVEVDTAALRGNVATLRAHAPDSLLMAVVKADAYGHGLVPSARALLDGGADWLGTAQLGEALALRAAGVTAPLLTWLHVPGTDLAPAVRAGIDLGVPAPWALDAVADAVTRAGAREPASVHLKVDTGLARGGAFHGPDWEDLVARAARLQADGVLTVRGVFSHFACADEPGHPSIAEQHEVFLHAVAVAQRHGLRPQLRHLSNSAATLTRPQSAFDLVRPGLACFGLSPVPQVGSAADLGLVPAMRLTASVHVAKRVPAGQGVSYGHTYRTTAESTVVDVPLGYGDGVPRAASGAGPVWIGGRRHRVSGRVCMDQFVVDVGDDPVAAGDEVVLFGSGRDGEPTAQDWAEAAGTISYEIVTRIGSRVPRVHVDSGSRAGTGAGPT